jgi:hypothetical protein
VITSGTQQLTKTISQLHQEGLNQPFFIQKKDSFLHGAKYLHNNEVETLVVT